MHVFLSRFLCTNGYRQWLYEYFPVFKHEYSSDDESCQESEESEVANEKTVVSLLDRLKSPHAS